MYDDETRARAFELLAQGHSAKMVSQMMGGHPTEGSIRAWAQGKVPQRTRAAGCMLTAAQKAEAVERVEFGEDYLDVAAEVGCTPAALLNWRKRYREKGVAGLRTRYDLFWSQQQVG